MNGESVSLLQSHGLDHFVEFSIPVVILQLVIWNCLWSKDSALEENTEAEIVLIETISITARLNIYVKKANLLTERIFQNRFYINGQVIVKYWNRVIRLRRSLSYSYLPCIVDSSTACMYCFKCIYYWNCLGDKARNISEKVSYHWYLLYVNCT